MDQLTILGSMYNKRAQAIPPSATLVFSAEARKLANQGIDIVTLVAGEPDFDTPAHITEAAIEALRAGKTRYTPIPGIPELREAIARKCVGVNGIQATLDDVLVTPTKMGVFYALQALVEEGDEVIIPDPSWVSYGPCTTFAGGVGVPAALLCNRGFCLDIETLKSAITPRTKVIVVNSPCNPTGGVFTKEENQAIADLAIDNDLWVLSDDIYEKLVYDTTHNSIASLPGMFERTITLNGFSKAYAMTGWRLGWVIAPPEVMGIMRRLQSHSLTCSTSFVQWAGIAALEGCQDCVEDMRVQFQQRRDFFVKGLNEIAGVTCRMPKGAFYAFPAFDVDMNSNDLALHLLKNAHVAGTPGSAFGANGEGHVRFSYAASMEELGKALERIEKGLAML